MAGCSVGSLLIFPLSGVLADAFGWRSVFYCTGAVSALWCCAWFALAYDTPDEHPWISEAERRLIKDRHGSRGGGQGQQAQS